MKTYTILLALLAFVLIPLSADNALCDESAAAISVFQSSPEVQPFFKDCYAYAIFPTVGKAAFVVGGAYGEGKVLRQGKVTGIAKLMQASFGLQLGGKAFSEIVFLQDKRAYDTFTKGDFAFDAQAEAVAVTAVAAILASNSN